MYKRQADGSQSLMLVKDNKIEQLPVTTGGAIKNDWLITSGLKAGDVVVVEGFQKIRPGAPVQASPWNKDKAGGAPAAGGQPPAQPGAKPADPAAKPADPAKPAQQAPAAGQKS